MRTTLSSLRTDRMVVERQRVLYQPPKSVSLVRLLRDAPAENARSEEHGTPEDDCAAARPGSRARRARSMPASDGDVYSRGNKQWNGASAVREGLAQAFRV